MSKLKNIAVTGVGMMGQWGKAGDIALDDVDYEAHIDLTRIRRADHISRCALTAASMALKDAGITNIENSERAGIILGTTNGALHYSLDYHASLVTGDPKTASPLLFSDSVPNAPVSHISTYHGIKGHSMTIQGYCSVAQSLKAAASFIDSGSLDLCLVGGADVNHPMMVELYAGCVDRPQEIMRTFGGSGFLVLEHKDHAIKRHAVVHALFEEITIITASRAQIAAVDDEFKDAMKETGFLYHAWDEEKDSRLRAEHLLRGHQGQGQDISRLFGVGFAAAEAFQVILSALACRDLWVLPVAHECHLPTGGRVGLLRAAMSSSNSLVIMAKP